MDETKRRLVSGWLAKAEELYEFARNLVEAGLSQE